MFKIFPATLTHDGRKVPVKGFNWRENCTNDQAIIASWSQQYPQLKFYGIPTGPTNNILLLDVDVKSGGLETIKKYHVPLTTSQRTMSGGIHYLYKYPDDGNTYGNKVGFDEGLDIRGKNGYGICYGLDSTPMCDAPNWLLEQALSNKEERIVNPEDIVKIAPEIVASILSESCENIRNAPEGGSNDVLNIEAYKVGQLIPSQSLDHDTAFNALFSAASDRGKPEYEAKATITSGFQGGAKNPVISPFGNLAPALTIPEIYSEPNDRWTPRFFSKYDLTNISKLRKPQVFKDWSTEDIHITTADGGTGKTTLKLCEAIALALGENFLGFECIDEGRTLFITGEDTKEKLGAMLGAILKQMGLLDGSPENNIKVDKVINAVVVKKASDLCLITKTKQGFIVINNEALDKVMEAVEDIRPKMIIFDPISSFWGSEAALNDMSKAIATFMGQLVEKSNACVEVINHMGKVSSTNKDMTQFAGRGGTGLPSHARVSRVLRPLFDEEFEELTGMELLESQSAMLCNVNKFTDGSPLYNVPFVIIREGYLFSKLTLIEQKVKEEQYKMSDNERVFTFIKTERREKRYPTKDVIVSHFGTGTEKISKARVTGSLSTLGYTGHMGEKTKHIENPDIEAGGKVYIITDLSGKEL